MLQPTYVLSNQENQLKEIYSQSLQGFISRTYFKPHILLTAESGAGKSTLISRLSTKKLRKILKLEIGKIRSTACTAKHIFDPELPKNVFGVSVTKKMFGKIRDDITTIIIPILAAKLVDYTKNNEDIDLNEVVESLYDGIFIKNKSLFNLNEICNELGKTTAIDIIKEQLTKIFTYMLEEKYIEKAKKRQQEDTSKVKKHTLKVFVEEEVARNIGDDIENELLEYLNNIFETVKIVVEEKVKTTFQSTNGDYLYSIFDVDANQPDATKFMKRLFGTSNDPKSDKNKGIQYFLDEVWIHVPTNEAYKENKPFVVIDTEGLTHRSNEDDEIRNNFIKLINYNRINHVIFMTPFATDAKVFNVIRDSLNTLKKSWQVSIFLPKYDEFVVSETVANGEDLEDEEDKETFFKEHIQPLTNKCINNIEESIKLHNLASKHIKFKEKIELLSFGESAFVKQTTAQELYSIISKILTEIDDKNITFPVKTKLRLDEDVRDIINFNIDRINLEDICSQVIQTNSFIKSIPSLIKKRPYWTSVYALKDKISYGNGHNTNADIYDNFSIYPARGILSSLQEIDLQSLIQWDFSNLLNVPAELKQTLLTSIQYEFNENISRRIALNLTYTNIIKYFYTSPYYLNWYRGLLNTYQTNLTDKKYWSNEIEVQLRELIKAKIDDLLDIQFCE